MKYEVTIEEKLSKTIEIEACTKEEAYLFTKALYDMELIVLDANDFCCMEIIDVCKCEQPNKSLVSKDKTKEVGM